jgi:hypothetical protein
VHLQDLTARDVSRFLGLANSLFEIVCDQRHELTQFNSSVEGAALVLVCTCWCAALSTTSFKPLAPTILAPQN